MYVLDADNLKILGHDYSIQQVNMLEIGNPGDCNYFLNVIRVADGMPETTMSEVILHEIIEAICNRCEIQIEHSVVCALSENLHQVLRDNELEFYRNYEFVEIDDGENDLP